MWSVFNWLWRREVVVVGSIGIFVIGSVQAIYDDEFALPVALFCLAILWLTSKVFFSERPCSHIGKLFLVVVGVVSFLASVVWLNNRSARPETSQPAYGRIEVPVCPRGMKVFHVSQWLGSGNGECNYSSSTEVCVMFEDLSFIQRGTGGGVCIRAEGTNTKK
jgi:hypothetical protein